VNALSRSFPVSLSCLLPLTVLQAETITVGGVGGLAALMQKLGEPEECRSLLVPFREKQ